MELEKCIQNKRIERRRGKRRIEAKNYLVPDRFSIIILGIWNRANHHLEIEDDRNRNYRFANSHGRKLIFGPGITGPRLLITVHQLTVTNGFFVNNTASVIADTRIRVISGYRGAVSQTIMQNTPSYEVCAQLRNGDMGGKRKKGGGKKLKSSLPRRSRKIAIVSNRIPVLFLSIFT